MTNELQYIVYALFSRSHNKIYIGQTLDINIRIKEHNEGLSRYTSKFVPWDIVYTEIVASRADALKREKQLKSQKGREFIWNIINQNYKV